jgi:hypothetical protein
VITFTSNHPVDESFPFLTETILQSIAQARPENLFIFTAMPVYLMKKKVYIRLAIACFLISIVIFLYGLGLVGLYGRNKVLVKAMACNCPDYEVITGSFKLARQLPDSIQDLNATEIFITGQHNPYDSDYTKTYDYYLITGQVSGIRQLAPGTPWNPVVNVSAWEHVNMTSIWSLLVPIVFFLVLSFRFRIKFVNANKPSMLEISLLAYEPEKDKPVS